MRSLSKSPLAVAQEALAAAKKALPDYSCAVSRRDFTQHQLFAILMLKKFFGLDYRGIVTILREWSDLRQALELDKVPHYSTLCYAEERLKGAFLRLMRSVLDRARALGLLRDDQDLSVDSTGLETRHASQHYRYRRARDRNPTEMPDWPKMTWAVDNPSHLIAGVWTGRGPSYDFGTLEPAVRQATEHLRAAALLADSGFDSEHNHKVAHEELGIARTLIALNMRGFDDRPARGRYRRQMQRHPCRRRYGQRWQVESTISQHKRRFGSALRARRIDAQTRECLFRVLIHNIAIVRPS